jgi:hypothetical protein
MPNIFEAVRAAISRGAIQVSRHAIRELEADSLLLHETLNAVLSGELIEDYPEAVRGPCCLVGGILETREWVHTVWGWDSASGIAVLITAYRPDPRKWEADFKTRRR